MRALDERDEPHGKRGTLLTALTDQGATRPRGAGSTLSAGLGWFSIGLGAAELLAPRLVARATGLSAPTAGVRLCGLRELAVGIGLLIAGDRRPWLAARLVGDSIDLIAIALALTGPRPGRRRARAAVGAVLGIALLDALAAELTPAPRRRAVRDYSGRSGWPAPAEQMRGDALRDFKPPDDMRVPAALRPWG